MPHELNYLIASSYRLSAERVMLSLQAGLSITNSRAPQSSPTGGDRVIGLCGQGGRHPYFELSRHHVERAAQQIRGGPPDLDFIQGVCEQLRALTSFNANTGCVNDRKPTLVPLMPPEEIWCNGVEVALDLWRLLSFDIDHVSSAAQLGFDPTDIALGSLSYNAVAFSNMMEACGNTTITFDVLETGFANPLSVSGSSPLTVSLRQLFLEAGSLLTPADPCDMAQWYAAVRYLSWIDSTGGDLRVRDSFAAESIDTRYRGLFSEEVAIGMMATLLRERYGVRMITNTAEYHYINGISHNGIVADFVADGVDPVNGTPMTVIAESKGSIRQQVSPKRKDHAKSQIKATPYSLTGTLKVANLAFASSLRYAHQKVRSYCEVIDPEPDKNLEPFDPVSGYRLAYAKALRFAGMEAAARQTYNGWPALALPDPQLLRDEPVRDDPRAQRSRRRRSYCREVLGVELVRDMGNSAFVVDSRVISVLRAGLNSETVGKIRHEAKRRRREAIDRSTSFVNSIGIGVVSFDDTSLES